MKYKYKILFDSRPGAEVQFDSTVNIDLSKISNDKPLTISNEEKGIWINLDHVDCITKVSDKEAE